MTRKEKNSAKIPIFKAIIESANWNNEASSRDIHEWLGENGFESTLPAVGMNVKRYRGHSWLDFEKRGRSYYYRPNATTVRTLAYLTNTRKSSEKPFNINFVVGPQKKSRKRAHIWSEMTLPLVVMQLETLREMVHRLWFRHGGLIFAGLTPSYDAEKHVLRYIPVFWNGKNLTASEPERTNLREKRRNEGKKLSPDELERVLERLKEVATQSIPAQEKRLQKWIDESRRTMHDKSWAPKKLEGLLKIRKDVLPRSLREQAKMTGKFKWYL